MSCYEEEMFYLKVWVFVLQHFSTKLASTLLRSVSSWLKQEVFLLVELLIGEK